MLHIHRAERADALVEALGAAPRRPARRPVRARGHRRPDPRHGALADAADVGEPRRHARPRRRHLRERRVPVPAPARRATRSPPRRASTPSGPVVAGSAPCGRCSRSSASASTSRGCAASRATSATRTTPTAARAASRPSATSPSCSTATRCTGRRWCAAGRAASDLPDEAAWQAELWRRLRERLGQPSPAERLEPACERLRAEPALVDLPRAPLALRPHAAAGRPPRRSCARSPPAATSTSSSCTRRPRCGRRSREPRRRCVRRADDDHRRARRATGCSPPGARTRARCSSCSAPHEHVDHHHPVELAERHAPRRLQADVRADRRPPGPAPDARRRSTRTTAASRSTPATAAPARSRSCATRSSPARRGRHARAARRDRHVPGHRDVRAADPGDVRRGRGGRGRRARAAADELRPTDLRVRLADRSLRQTNPVLGVVARLLDLAGQPPDRLARCSTSPTASRSAAASGSTTTTSRASSDWVADSGIRWGLDAAHRAPFKLEDLTAGTWRRASTACWSA